VMTLVTGFRLNAKRRRAAPGKPAANAPQLAPD
jgi:hypothetical protein